MPKCGSQITICDVPIRFDTYEGCSHLCQYCFVQRKFDVFNSIKPGESAETLKKWISGERTRETNWCDWDIPLHWGGMSDPFQPVERKHKRSLECLKVFAESQYPFIVSTKNKMIAEGEYLDLIKRCNCIVQFSACCDEYDKLEQGASTYKERIDAASKIAPYKRVIIRCQPYIPAYFKQVFASIKHLAEIGVYGVVFESMKYQNKAAGTIKIGNDNVYPSKMLEQQFIVLRDECHKYGLKFYSGENRLRSMGDSLCCCGAEGMGWRLNTANLNHYLFDKENFKFTKCMEQKGNTQVFKCNLQSSIGALVFKMSYKEVMELFAKTKSSIVSLLPDEIAAKYNSKKKK